MDLGLKGKVSLVTASSRGLGFAIAEQLASEGSDLVMCSREKAKIEAASSVIREKYNSKVVTIEADVSNKEHIDRLFNQVQESFGRLDILVCNAGGPKSAPFHELLDEDWERAFQTNVMSVVRLIRGAIPLMKENGWGRVAAIASTSVKQPIPDLILSNTMRIGVAGLMKTLASELAPLGILLNTVCPGRIDTDRVKEIDEGKANRTGTRVEDIRSALESSIPLGRYGRPEEFARVVSFLVSEANSYVTGTVQLVDGGMTQTI